MDKVLEICVGLIVLTCIVFFIYLIFTVETFGIMVLGILLGLIILTIARSIGRWLLRGE